MHLHFDKTNAPTKSKPRLVMAPTVNSHQHLLAHQSGALFYLLLLSLQLSLVFQSSSQLNIENIQHKISKYPIIQGAVLLQPQNKLAHFKQLHYISLQRYQQQSQNNQEHNFNHQQQHHRSNKQEEKICIGTSNKLNYNHQLNLADKYTNCTHVIGNLEITYVDSQLDLSFLESIREITGYLLLSKVNVDKIRMPNLQIIRGKDLFKLAQDDKEEFAMILIENEQLKTLELPNLREILSGSFGSFNNKNLCHIRTINWEDILNTPYRSVFVYNGTEPECPACDASCQGSCWAETADMCQRPPKTNCAHHCGQNRCFGPGPNECCHDYCAGGCFGPNKTDCVACKNFYNDGVCVSECPPLQLYNPSTFQQDMNPSGKYAFGATCVKECPKDLLRDNGACVRVCPAGKKGMDGECFPCGATIPCPSANATNQQQASESTATNNGNIKDNNPSLVQQTNSTNQFSNSSSDQATSANGDYGCKAIINSTSISTSTDPTSTHRCIKLDEPCPDGFYQEYAGSTSRPVCRKCHHRCRKCTGMGTHHTVCECSKYIAGEQCEDYCPRDYFADEKSRKCVRCSPECNGCHGPTEADCQTCRVYRIYLGTEKDQEQLQQIYQQQSEQTATLTIKDRPFNCTSQCPEEKPYRISESNLPDLYCSDVPDMNPDAAPLRMNRALGSTSILLMLIVSAAIMLCVSVHRFQSEKDKTVKLTMHLSGIDDVEPLNPSNLKPNLAPLRSIKETELRKGNELGSGFGGTVYQGLWYPEGRENKNPRPVAIKVLRDNGQSNMNKKFLDEAYIMASVNHANLVQLLAVCMTPKHLMLVTPLMPLGCLLEHVKKHRHDISSKNLLEWSKQIAKGMSYLEEHRMVHRDLALRNVLLKTCGRAMISDFGLAKFLEIDQSEYHSLGGRLPIKWLAPECIRERRFTHKSDVWAFGVTIWELFTFGARPFEEYNLKDMLAAIENGARLEQPPYLTTEVYSVMLSCWFYKPEARPSFRQLTQEFVKFAQDPQRYVAIGSKGVEFSLNTSKSFSHPNDQFPNSANKQQLRQQQHQATGELESSDEADEYTDSDFEHSCLDEVEQPPLISMPEFTPSTHNRINEMFGFDFRRQQHRSVSSDSSEIQKTPTTPLKRMHFASEHLIEEDHVNDHDDLVEVDDVEDDDDDDDDIDVFKSAHKLEHLDGNNNFISVRPDSWQHLQNGTLSQSSHKIEQPTDLYDYLLPSPCTEDRNFSHLYGATSAYDEVDSSRCKRQQQQQQMYSNTLRSSVSSAKVAVELCKQPQPSPGVNNYEYFLTRASSQYLSNSTHYADMMDTTSSNNSNNNRQQQRLQQHLSSSNGNIPHSLV